jgi:hypothetical protein
MSSDKIPTNVMRMLDAGKKKSNVEVITDYLIAEPGSVILTELQLKLLERIEKVDELFRTGKYTSKEVANIVSKQFDQSLSTSWRDIDDARTVLGSTRKSNKKYLLAIHTDRIEAAIIFAQSRGRLDLLAKLFDAYTKACMALPEDKEQHSLPTAIILNITQNNIAQLTETPLTELQASAIARERLAQRGIILDADFEEEDDDE